MINWRMRQPSTALNGSILSPPSNFEGDKTSHHESGSLFQTCSNIDESLSSLYPSSPELLMLPKAERKISYEWILDGDVETKPKEEVDGKPGCERKQLETKNSAEEALNSMLNHMELEQMPLNFLGNESNALTTCDDVRQVEDTEDDEWGEFVSASESQEKIDFAAASPTIPTTTSSRSFEPMIDEERVKIEMHYLMNGGKSVQQDEALLSQANDQRIIKSIVNDRPCVLSSESFYDFLKCLPNPTEQSLEGRFIQRILVDKKENDFDDSEEVDEVEGKKLFGPTQAEPWWKKTEKSIEMELSNDFYTTKYSPVIAILENYPTNDDDIEEYLTKELCQLDVAYKRIFAKLTSRVQTKYELIVGGMKGAYDVDVEIAKAHMFASKACHQIQIFKESSQTELCIKNLNIVQSRENLLDIEKVINMCEELLDEEKDLIYGERGKENFKAVIERAVELKTRVLNDSVLKQLSCLQGLRERSHGIMHRLKRRVECTWLSSLIRECCLYDRSFRCDEYMLLLIARAELQPFLSSDEDVKSSDWIEFFSRSILSNFRMEVTRAFVLSLLPTLQSSFNIEDIQSQIEKCSINNKDVLKNLLTNGFEQNTIDLQTFENVCESLLDILYIYNEVVSWHETQNCHDKVEHNENNFVVVGRVSNESILTIGNFLKKSRGILWDECSFCLHSILSHYVANEKGRTSWDAELFLMENTLNIIDSFLSVQEYFCGRESVGGELIEIFEEMSKKWLRSLHVEAMNGMGEILSEENWNAVHIDIGDDGFKEGVLSFVKQSIPYLNGDFEKQSNVFNFRHSFELLPCFERFGCSLSSDRYNYFSFNDSVLPYRCEEFFDWDKADADALFCQINSHTNNPTQIQIGTAAATTGICKWTGRLLIVALKLPVLLADVTVILKNIYDLYILTVTRLCMGSSANEKVVFTGYENDANFIDFLSEENTPRNKTGGRFFNSPRDRRQNVQKNYQKRAAKNEKLVPPNVEALICAPLKHQKQDAFNVAQYLDRGRTSLQNIVNLEKIESWIIGKDEKEFSLVDDSFVEALMKRFVAAQSSLFVTAVLYSACSLLEKLEFKDICDNPKFRDNIVALFRYSTCLVKIIPFLVSQLNCVVAIRALKAKHIVTEIIKIGDGWEKSSLNEQCNHYVDDLCERCAQLWLKLTSYVDQSSFTSHMLKLLWEQIILGGFLALLEGFSKIYSCSTEGRALMSMDLATFASGVSPNSLYDKFNLQTHREQNITTQDKPSVHTKPKRGMQYVDAYIKVFYFDKMDTMKWISENYEMYHISHCISLVLSGAGGRSGTTKLDVSQMIKIVKEFYQ